MSQKRRNYSPQFKFETVMEGLRGEKTVAEICRERDIKESLYYKWRDQFLETAPDLFTDKRRKNEPDNGEAQQRIADLERLVGRLTLENEILKKAESWLSTQQRRNGR
jgi:transposase-like protein